MAFLDNSGDIILDAVLTDAGRKRLARADGTFYVQKFAFGDDEIDYSSYDGDHASGSAYFDLEILQTPILEAFTNNRSSLKSKLISISNNNLFYLPELVLNQNTNRKTTQMAPESADGASYQPLCSGSFLISVSKDTNADLNTLDVLLGRYLNGFNPSSGDNFIRVDQGLNTTKLDPNNSLASELTEQQYMVQIDHRLGSIVDMYPGAGQASVGSPSFIDDDQIATYFVTRNVGGYIDECQSGELAGDDTKTAQQPHYEVIDGPRGTKLRFGLKSSSNLQASSYLFETIGREGVTVGGKTFNVIDSTVKVTGVSTGYSIDIPVTFCKSTS